MKISEVMTSDVQTVTPDQSAREAANFMLRAEAGSIPVIEGDKVIGMITDRDIAVRGVAEGRGPDTPVRDLMTDHVICARSNDDVDDVVRRMGEEQVRRLPVVGENGGLVGILSLGDVLAKAADKKSVRKILLSALVSIAKPPPIVLREEEAKESAEETKEAASA